MACNECPQATHRKPWARGGFLPSSCNVLPEADLPKIRDVRGLAQRAFQRFQQAIDIGVVVVMRDADADHAVIRIESDG